MVAIAFNAQQYTPQYSGGGGLPPGRHKVVISASEAKPVKNKPDNGMLAFTLTCIEGPLQGQSQIDNLNLWNTNAQAVEIANKQLSAYCHVTGKFMVNDTAELHNIPFQIEIAQQKDNPQYTEVVRLFDINGNEPGKSGASAAPAPAPQAPPAAPPAGVAATGTAPAPQWPTAPAPQPEAQPAPAAAPAPAWPGAGQPAAQPAQPAWPGAQAPQGQPPAWPPR